MRTHTAMWLNTVLLLLTAQIFAGSASGATPETGYSVWATVHGSWNIYEMSDVNDEILLMQAEIPGLKRIVGQGGMGGSFGYTSRSSRFMIGVGFERMYASTEGSLALQGARTTTVTIKESLPANAVRGMVGVDLPHQGPLGATFALGVGSVALYQAAVEQRQTTDGGASSSLKFDLEGRGLLVEGSMAMTYALSPGLALQADLGYRHAKISEVEAATRGIKSTMRKADGSVLAIDYSGLVTRAGIRFSLP
jgi:hypothetical protein